MTDKTRSVLKKIKTHAPRALAGVALVVITHQLTKMYSVHVAYIDRDTNELGVFIPKSDFERMRLEDESLYFKNLPDLGDFRVSPI